GKLIALYDSNDISLDGDLNRSFSDNTEQRFKAYGWQVIRVNDGNDLNEIQTAIKEAKRNTEQPTLIEVKTIIGYGSPNKSNSAASHGAPLGTEEVGLTKEYYKWSHEPFTVPEEVYNDFKTKVADNGQQKEKAWNEQLASYKEKYPVLGKELESAMAGKLPEDWDINLPVYEPGKDELATRAASGEILNGLAKSIPCLFGGSADLAGSNKTAIKEEE